MTAGNMTGRTYLERGKPVVLLARWGPGGGPRNVLIQRADGAKVVRPVPGTAASGSRAMTIPASLPKPEPMTAERLDALLKRLVPDESTRAIIRRGVGAYTANQVELWARPSERCVVVSREDLSLILGAAAVGGTWTAESAPQLAAAWDRLSDAVQGVR